MFTIEQKALVDRLESCIGARIVEVADISAVENDRLRESVSRQNGRRSWFGKDGGTLYVFTPNLPDGSVQTLMKEVLFESVAQKGLDALGPRSTMAILDEVWRRADHSDRLSVAYANRLNVNNLNNLGRDASRAYLSSLRSKGYAVSGPLYEDVALAVLTAYCEAGFDLSGEKDVVGDIVSALRIFNDYHPVPLCGLKETGQISGVLTDIVKRNTHEVPADLAGAKVSFGKLSSLVGSVTGYDDRELSMPLGFFLKQIHRFGIDISELGRCDFVGRIMNPVAVFKSRIEVPKRDSSGIVTSATGMPVKVTEERFCVLTDIRTYDREDGCSKNLAVVLPSLKENFIGRTDDVSIRGFLPMSESRVLGAINSNGILWADERMVRYLEGLGEKQAEKKRRPSLANAGSNSVSSEGRLNYVTNIVKDFVLHNAGKKFVEEFSSSPEDGRFDMPSLQDERYSGSFPEFKRDGWIRKADLKTRLEVALPEREFSKGVYSSLRRAGILSGMDVLRCDGTILRPKDISELSRYMEKIGVPWRTGKEAGQERSFDDRYLVDFLVGCVTGQYAVPPHDDLSDFLARYPLDGEIVDSIKEKAVQKSIEYYYELDDAQKEDIRAEVEEMVRKDDILPLIVRRSLNEQGIFPKGVFRLSDRCYEAFFPEGGQQSRSFVVDFSGKGLHDGYFHSDAEGRLGFEVDGNVLSGQVITSGLVRDVCLDLETGRQIDRGAKKHV